MSEEVNNQDQTIPMDALSDDSKALAAQRTAELLATVPTPKISLPLLEPATPGYDEYYKPRRWLSFSSISNFIRCPRLFFYASGCRLSHVGGEHHALDYGSAMHKALPIILETGNLAEAYEAFCEVWKDRDMLGDPKRNSTVAKLALVQYATERSTNWEIELIAPPQNNPVKDAVPPENRRSDFEIPFAISLPNVPVPFVGFIDFVGRHKRTGKLWIGEFKTTSQMGMTFNNSWPLNPQVLMYASVAQELYGEEVEGAVVEAVQSAKTKQENATVPVIFTQQNLAEAVSWTSMVCQQILDMERTKNFPKNFFGCSPYPMFGQHGFGCRYRELCSVQDWQQFSALYNVRHENPFAGIDVDAE